MSGVDDLWWRDEDADYIRHRGDRYPGATDLDVDWTLEAAADPRCVVQDPDPRSRSRAVRIIGYSPSALLRHHDHRHRHTHAGVTAWKRSGADLRDYEGQG